MPPIKQDKEILQPENIENVENTSIQHPEQKQSPEKYREIELGDKAPQSVTTNVQHQNQQNAQVQNNIPAPIDPEKELKKMISAGYTPPAQVITHMPEILKNGNTSLSEFWFAILLQKLLRDKK